MELISKVVSLGPILTPSLFEYAGDDAAPWQGMVDHTASRKSLGRVGQSEEIARVALFLATEDSSFVNGSELFANGSQTQFWPS